MEMNATSTAEVSDAAAAAVAPDQRAGRDVQAALVQLSILFVNWNSLDYLMESIASIYEHAPSVLFEMIVVDNASSEAGLERLVERFAQVRLVRSESNLGFAGANNLGFQHSRGRYILLLNPDTRVIGPAIDRIINESKAGRLTADIVDNGVALWQILHDANEAKKKPWPRFKRSVRALARKLTDRR